MTAPLEPLFRKPYILGGQAKFTVVSKFTGQRFTYMVISGSDLLFFVSVLIGPDNVSDFKGGYLGTLTRHLGGSTWVFRHGVKSQISLDAPSAKAFAWVWRHLDSTEIEVWHSGKCSRCSRELTDPE